MVKTLPFHGSNMGSTPIRCIALWQKGDSQPSKRSTTFGSCTLGLTSSAGEFRRISGFTVIFVCWKALDKGLVLPELKTHVALTWGYCFARQCGVRFPSKSYSLS